MLPVYLVEHVMGYQVGSNTLHLVDYRMGSQVGATTNKQEVNRMGFLWLMMTTTIHLWTLKTFLIGKWFHC